MKWTGLNELRQSFLDFFESKEHKILPSASLIPKDDPSLLLINSGMAPLKNYFTGVATPPSPRIATCQKCVRVLDIENVGITSRHGTFFEMLGNFSFGDYFKSEVTAWAWEYLTKVLEMPEERLWVSVYLEDDETFDIWVNQVGINPERMVRLGKADNYWEIGVGPCGPCTEIYFDRGEQFGCDNPDCKAGCECDRYVEIWNLVFSQFSSDGKGNYSELAKKNIDTGMGLERLACMMQGVESLFEVDTIRVILDEVAQMAGISYNANPKLDMSLRVVTDHIRSSVMMIGDGITPNNEGRGYVLRRLMRRAIRHGMILGIKGAFLHKLVGKVIDGAWDKSLSENMDYIVKVIKSEEERFSQTLHQGMELLNSIIDRRESAQFASQTMLKGDFVFKLYDTFGFPLDLTKEILAERSLSVNEDEFTSLMTAQRERARAARASLGQQGWEESSLAGIAETVFVGYDKTEAEATIIGMLADGVGANVAEEGQKAVLVLDSTPFYAEGGGQVGDSGEISIDGSIFMVADVKKNASGNYLHYGTVTAGTLSVGDKVIASVKNSIRNATMRNHTSCHLLQYALREVLGSQVHQSGSYVDNSVLRFDFTHMSAVTREELLKVEMIVNEMILSALPVTATEMHIEEAKEKGAIALFSEKYSDVVRVVSAGEHCVELCGGTHVTNTSHIGLFKIVSESSVAAGVRRIEAITGANVMVHLNELSRQLELTAGILKAPIGEVVTKATSVMNAVKEQERTIEILNERISSMRIKDLFSDAVEVNGVKIITAALNGSTADGLRTLGDRVKDAPEAVVGVFSSIVGEKATLLAACSKKALDKGAHAGKLIKELTAMCGGSGGGRPDSAMGGTPNVFQVDEVMAKAGDVIATQIG